MKSLFSADESARVRTLSLQKTSPAFPEAAFFLLDSQWCFRSVNEQAEQWLNRAQANLLGRSLWEAFPSTAGTIFEEQYLAAVRTGIPVAFEGFSLLQNKWFEVHAYPSEEGLSVYFLDINERKGLEERLRLLESVVVHANDTVIITEARPLEEPGPRILYVNEAFTRMTGYSAQEAVGRSPRFLQGPLTMREPLDTIRHALKNWQPCQVELLNYRKDGSTFWAEMSIVPVADESGQFTHFISIQRDVSERRQQEAALQQAKDEAERANRAKSEFLSRMSHELRTPLNAILGFGQLLEMSSLAYQDHENVNQVLRAGRHLLDLINEVLEISRIETGELSVSLEPVDIETLVSETVDLVRPLAAQREITIHIVKQAPSAAADHDKAPQDASQEDESPARPHVKADQQRLKQVLLNLLANAVKYNRAGGKITLWCQPRANDLLRISVQDEGEGIAPDKQERLFTPFDRLDAEGSGVEGTGIGLSLSQSLTRLMHGSLGFESTEGQGSTFWVELPLTELPSYAHVEENSLSESGNNFPQLSRRRVLYIEDNAANIQLIERLVQRHYDIELLSCRLGVRGLEMARQCHPDLILLDLHLPDTSGQDVLRQLREGADTREIPVVVVSADATKGQVQRLLQAGAQSYLTKPFEIRTFFRTIDQLLAL